MPAPRQGGQVLAGAAGAPPVAAAAGGGEGADRHGDSERGLGGDAFSQFVSQHHALVGCMVEVVLAVPGGDRAATGVGVSTSVGAGTGGGASCSDAPNTRGAAPAAAAGGVPATTSTRTATAEAAAAGTLTGILHTIDPVTQLVYIVSLPAVPTAGSAAVAVEAPTPAPAGAAASPPGVVVVAAAPAAAAASTDVCVHMLNFRTVVALAPRSDLARFELVLGRRSRRSRGARRAGAESAGPSVSVSLSSAAARETLVPEGGSGERGIEGAGNGENDETAASTAVAAVAVADAADAEFAARNKARVMQQLQRFRVAVSEDVDGTLRVLQGALRIHPPYGLADCVSTNETVLQRVAQMLEFE